MTFQNDKYLAFGLYVEMTKPAARRPKAEATRAKVPVYKLDADALCLKSVSMSFGEKIQNGMNLVK